MAQYKKMGPSLVDEVEEYFKLPRRTLITVTLSSDWHAQFPHLSQLAQVAIPGKHIQWCSLTNC